MADYKITLDDQDALDAISAEQDRIEAVTGKRPSVEAYVAGFVTTQHILMRKGQVMAEASLAVAQAAKDFDDRQEAKKPKPSPEPMPAEPVDEPIAVPVVEARP